MWIACIVICLVLQTMPLQEDNNYWSEVSGYSAVSPLQNSWLLDHIYTRTVVLKIISSPFPRRLGGWDVGCEAVVAAGTLSGDTETLGVLPAELLGLADLGSEASEVSDMETWLPLCGVSAIIELPRLFSCGLVLPDRKLNYAPSCFKMSI